MAGSILSCTDPVAQEWLDIEGYYPLSIGADWVYDIDETTIDGTGQTHSVYQLKSTITGSITNPDGSHSFVIHRAFRPDEAGIWMPLDTWAARRNLKELIVTEKNTAFVKLISPIRDGTSWNGNSFNSLPGDDQCGLDGELCDQYRYTLINEPFSSGELAFDETITVNQNNNTDIIVSYDVRKEVYARGVGLVYKESTILEYCTEDACLGDQIVSKGYILKQTMVSYEGI